MNINTLEDFRRNSPMNKEFDAWQDVVKEFRELRIEINDKRYDPLIRAICVWGERLHALRATQSSDQVEKALIDNLNYYGLAKKGL